MILMGENIMVQIKVGSNADKQIKEWLENTKTDK